MSDIRNQDFYRKASSEEQEEMLSFFLKTKKLKENGSISYCHIEGIGRRPALKTLHYADFDMRSCVANWNSNIIGLSVNEGHICNPIISENYEFIYFLLDSDNLIYVGRTTKLFTRIDSHSYDKQFDRYKWILVEKEYVDFLEKYFIDVYRPIENRFIAKPLVPTSIPDNSWIILGGNI
ncbi:GIY-YIG nuclease family protein [Vibrio parahaemolyticus]|nr:GIY-YIG nuclease family protein [Vibrio parahaemolyticus]